jgi:alcohol dehydrogenase
VVCGTLMASANEINVRELRKISNVNGGLEKYAFLGRLFLDAEGKSGNYYIDGFIQFLLNLTDDLQLPGLKQFGIDEKDIESICRITEIKNNPVKLSMEALTEIVSSRL